PTPVQGNAVEVILRLRQRDERRVRIWKKTLSSGSTGSGGSDSTGGTGGTGGTTYTLVLGPGKPRTYRVARKQGANPAAGWREEFYIEALTLAYDPSRPAPRGKAPPPPGAQRTPAPATTGGSQVSPTINTTNTAASIYDTESRQLLGEVWLDVIHKTQTGRRPASLRDVGLFTIAPWIMTWNTLDVERVYVILLTHTRSQRYITAYLQNQNHAMVWDLQHGCSQAGVGSAPNTDTTQEIPTSSPGAIRNPNDVPFYVVDGTHVVDRGTTVTSRDINVATTPRTYTPTYSYTYNKDRWIQDEFEIGYCYGPHHWLHVAVHLPRNRGVAKFVEREMAHPGLGIFNALDSGGGPGSVNYGGNLEVSPPVSNATAAIPASSDPNRYSGPSIKQHRAAPFGKIILGDSKLNRVQTRFRNFLFAQRVQPVVPVDTAWLGVGHVDEFMTFVRATSGKNFRMLLADVPVMTNLLTRIKNADPSATMHAGKYRVSGTVSPTAPVLVAPSTYRVRYRHGDVAHYVEEFVEDTWLRSGLRRIHGYSQRVWNRKLRHIRDRLVAALDLDPDADVLPIPTYFKPSRVPGMRLGVGENYTVAENVGMVNMLVVNDHLMVPRPYGPRLPLAQARQVVREVLADTLGSSAPPVRPTSADPHYFWARPRESLEKLALYFARPAPRPGHDAKEVRRRLIRKIHNPSASLGPSQYQAAVDTLKNAILNEPENRNAPTPIQNALTSGSDPTFTKWMHVRIPGDTVDVFEMYMKSILEAIGNTVHFVDDFESYHEQWGEVHCGTNAKRKPPELHSGFTSRWWDSGVYDPDYDTTYDPDA
ncbi:MAG: protein-arginine deiminase family protein, partial [Phycisphaerae bacterium]